MSDEKCRVLVTFTEANKDLLEAVKEIPSRNRAEFIRNLSSIGLVCKSQAARSQHIEGTESLGEEPKVPDDILIQDEPDGKPKLESRFLRDFTHKL